MGNNAFATREPGEPFVCGVYYYSGGASVWFRWVAPGNGMAVFDTLGSSFDTTLAAYIGTSLPTLWSVACNDDWFGYGLRSRIAFPAVSGTEYFITIDGYGSFRYNFGNYYLNWYGLTNIAPPPSLTSNEIQFSSSLYTINEGQPGYANVTVDYAGGAPGAVTVDYTTSDGTAVEPFDYEAKSGTITFNPGESNYTFAVRIRDNSFANSNKTVLLTLSNPTGGAMLGDNSNSVVLIIDDESVPATSTAGQISFATSNIFGFELESYTENYRDIPGVLVTVTRTGGSTGRVLVDYSTMDNWGLTNYYGTNWWWWYWGYTNMINGFYAYPGIPNSDYYPTNGTLVFDDYQMSATFWVRLIPYSYLYYYWWYWGYSFFFYSDYIYVPLALSNPRPAAEEEAMRPGAVAPTLGAITNAYILIRDVYAYTNAFTFRRLNTRVDEYDGGFWLWVWLPGGGPGEVRVRTIRYPEGLPLMTGSDYTHGITRTNPNPAYTDGFGPLVDNADYIEYNEVWSFGANTVGIGRYFPIVINDDTAEFNEDIFFGLYWMGGGNPVPNPWGDICNVSILYDDQPAGAADRDWNPHGVHFTSPPFNPSPGANNTVNSVAIQADQKTVIGGNFTAYNGTIRSRIARINPNGLLDETFMPGNGANDSVNAVGVYPFSSPLTNILDKILIGGNFTSYDGILRKRIARINAGGSLDTTFNPGDGANGSIHTILPMQDGKVLIGGDFTRCNGVTRNRIARLNQNGSLDLSFDPGRGADGTVWSIAVDNSSMPIQVNAGYSGSGTNEFRTNINTGARSGTISVIFAPMCEFDDLRVYYGQTLIFDSGMTNEYRGTWPCDIYQYTGPLTYIIRYGPGPATDITFVVNEGGNLSPTTVWDLQATIENEVAGQHVLVGGQFTTFDGVERNGIARLSANGVLDTTFDPGSGVDGPIFAVAAQNDLKVLIGGAFSDFDYRSRNNIARLNVDGSLDSTYDPGLGFDNAVYAITVQPDGKALVGGRFTSYDTVRRMGLTRIMTNGVIDTSFMDTAYNQFAGLINTFSFHAPNFINAIAMETNGNIMIAGSFTNIGGNSLLPYYWYRQPEFYSGRMPPYRFYPSYTRADKIPRYNVARLIGGYTPGPGICELSLPAYSANENDGTNTVTLRRMDGRLGTLQSYMVTSNRIAQAGVDFVFSKSPVTWQEFGYPGNAPRSVGWINPKYFNVPLIDNLLMDGNRALDLLLVEPQGSINLNGEVIPLGGGRARMSTPLTIIDNDFPKGVLAFSDEVYYVNEYESFLNLTIIRTNGSDGWVGVSYFTLDLTADAGDYSSQAQAITFAPGVTSATISIPIYNDSAVEFDETFKIVLTNATGGATLPGGSPVSFETAYATIIDDDFAFGRLNFLTTNFTARENSGAALITVTRTGGNANSIAVSVATADGTAQAGVDYGSVVATLQWNDGDTAPRSFFVLLTNNVLVDGNRTVNLAMFNPSTNGLLGNRPTATLNIQDDDSYGRLAFSHAGYEANENGTNLLITVVRSSGVSGAVAVEYAALGGTAVPGKDYLLSPGRLTLGPNQSSAAFTVQLINNPEADGNRTILLGLNNFSNAAPALITNTTVIIVDDETVNMPAGSLDTTFSPVAGPDKPIYALALQTNGNLIIGGDFTDVHGVTRRRLARLLPTGTLDPNFNAGQGPNRPVRSLLLQPDGKLIVGGFFTSVDGTNRNHIARLHQDGTLDTGFDPGGGADNPIYTMALEPDGRIVIGGLFTTYNGVTRPKVAIINTNGTLDGSFDTGMGPDGIVYAVAIQADGKILIGGDFTSVNNSNRVRIARLNADGSLDDTFDPGLGADATIRSILIQPDGMILIGGSFASYDGTNRAYLARLDQQGRLDPSFLDGEGVGADNAVYAMCLQPDEKILVVGDFTAFNSVTRRRITRLNSDGATDPTINFGLGANSFIAAILIQPDRKIVIGGGFTTFDEKPRYYLARLYGGSIDGNGSVQFTANSFVVSENASNAVITVRRIGGLAGDVTVDFWTTNGTAVPNVNYRDTSGTLTFPQGEVLQTFPVPLINVPAAAPPCTVNLFLTNTTGGLTLGPQPTATLTILSDDSVISFLTGNFGVNENAPSGEILISVFRDGATNTSVSVDYSTRDGTAVNGLDYIGVRDSLTFTPGEILKTFAIPILNDNIPKGNRTVLLELTNSTVNASLGIANAVLTIFDDDFAIGQVNLSSATYFVNEYETNLVITIVRTNGSTGIISVDYATTDGTAHAGLDYLSVSGTKSFSDGETIKTFNIPILQDYYNHTNTAFIVTLSNATAGATLGPISAAIVTILNTELINGSFSFSRTNYSTNEGAGQIQITVNRSFGFLGPVSVGYRTFDGTAFAAEDYDAVTNSLFWDDGDRNPKSFPITIANDDIVEAAEQFWVELFLNDPTNGATLGGRTNAIITILNDDFGPGFLSFASSNYTVMENATNAIITVLRTYGDTGTVSVVYSTMDGSGNDGATNGVDYVGVTNLLTFTDGVTNASFSVPILDRPTIEINKQLLLQLSSPSNGASLGAITSAVLTIIENQQQAGSIDAGFNNLGANGQVNIIVYQTNTSKLLVGGDFTLFNGVPRGHFARMNPNGSLDASFDVAGALNSSVRAIALQPDGKVLVGGAFTNAFSSSNSYLVRLNLDASMDTNFFAGVSGVDNLVEAIAIQTDNKIVIGGQFSTVNGTNRNFIARLLSNGQLDPNFNPLASADGVVRALAIQYDGKILLAGDFQHVNGVSRLRIARLLGNGDLDTTFTPGLGAYASVRSLVFDNTGLILIGGLFQNYNGTLAPRVARLDLNGGLDTNFLANLGSGADEFVSAIGVQPDHKIIVVGGFNSFNGFIHHRITRLNRNGSVDTAINFGSGANNYITTLALQPDRKIVIGGGFTEFDGAPRYYLARLNGGDNLGEGSIAFSSTNYNVLETAASVTVTVRRNIGTTNNVRVDFATSDGTALAGLHYLPTNGALRFAPGETIKTFDVSILYDPVITPDRTINLTLSNLTGAAVFGSPSNATITIQNIDCRLGFALAAYSVSENGGYAQILVERIGSTVGAVTVDYTQMDNTALAGFDYILTNGTLTLLNGQANATFYVPIINDTNVQGDLSLDLLLRNPTGPAALGLANAILTIVEDDYSAGSFNLSQPNYDVSEQGAFALISVLRVGGSSGGASVQFTTSDGSAVSGFDYRGTNGLLVFADGEIAKTFAVPILDDVYVEGNEVFNLTLFNPTGAQIGQGLATVTILADEAIFTHSTNNYIAYEASNVVTVMINRSTNGTGPVSVYFVTTNGTALAGQDYLPTNGLLTWPVGDFAPKTIDIPIINDLIGEPVEQFYLVLSNPGGESVLGATNIAAITILDDDISFVLEYTNYLAYEIAGTVSTAAVNVIRIGGTNGPASVNFRTSDGTAISGPAQDYGFTSLTLNFADGETNKLVGIPIWDDLRGEGNEYFYVDLFGPSTNASIGGASRAVVIIVDNEDIFSLSSSNYVVDEGVSNAVITILRSGGVQNFVTIGYLTTNLTAIPGTNYLNVSNIINFAPLETVRTFTIPILDDNLAAGNVTVGISIFGFNIGSATLVEPTNAILTILDNDISLGFETNSFTVDESASNIVLTVTRYGALSNYMTIFYVTSNGTATADADYRPVSNSFTFGPMDTNLTIQIDIIDDLYIEGNEMFTVHLYNTNLTNITFRGGGAATVNILDNDASIIVPAGSALIGEQTTNGFIDVGETVTLNFGLRNLGNVPTVDLQAALLATNGITSPSSFQRYGVVPADGSTISRPFTFTATGTTGATISATFSLVDIDLSRPWTNRLGLISFNFVIGQAQYIFSSSESIILTNDAFPYPSTILVSNVPGKVIQVSLAIRNLSHTFPSDIDMLLANPQDKTTVFMSDAGAGFPVYGIANLIFTDSASTFLPFDARITAGTYKPTNYTEIIYGTPSIDFFPPPAPPGISTNCTLAALKGGDPNGPWRLFVVDDMEWDDGNIAGGWILTLTTSDAGTPAADLAMSGFVDQSVIYPNQTVTYTLAVSNNGPSSASAVYITNFLPANVSYLGCDINPLIITNNLIIVYLDNLTNNSGRVFHLEVRPNTNAFGRIVLLSQAVSSQNDLNLNNNIVSLPADIRGAPDLALEWKDNHRDLALSWPAALGYDLQMTYALSNQTIWFPVTNNIIISGGRCIIEISPTNSKAFFRLNNSP